jgi:uncharacterized protein
MNILEKYAHIVPHIGKECQVRDSQAQAVLRLLYASNTVPFIARYRKEATGNLDEVAIRSIFERFTYAVELEERKEVIIESIKSQDKLSDELGAAIKGCATKAELEDLYLPYKPKRRTRGTIARERGLEPLAFLIMEQPLDRYPEEEAQKFINTENEINNNVEALRGARDIVAEIMAQDSTLRFFARNLYKKAGLIVSKKRDDVKGPTKFEDYYNFSQLLSAIPSHRYLAIARGERENILRMSMEVPRDFIIEEGLRLFKYNNVSPFAFELKKALEDSYQRLLAPAIENDLLVELKIKSDKNAIEIFAQNLRTILLSAPLGSQTVIGIDPGLRTGCKCAVVQASAKFVDHGLLYLNNKSEAERTLLALINKHKPMAIAVGNGTGGRECEAFVRTLVGKDIIVVSVSESGASVYSASDIAREEFPDLDLTIRGAISIARRLQDPLSELVKVEPKALGVGQYQHDLYQPLLEKKLHEVVESCVNQVGVDLNTASVSLLSYVAGIGPSVAKKIVSYREQHGRFKNRYELKSVAGLGPKTFEQAAGFLHIPTSDNILDSSSVHPERYELIEHIAKEMNVTLSDLVGNPHLISTININTYVNDELGLATLKDIVEELKKPGRDPRAQFESPAFRDDINSIDDLAVGMILEGVVTNVAAFGAFVDIGVHQDGLIHISKLSERFVHDASSVVSPGHRLKVEILALDKARKRITLSACKGQKAKMPQKEQNATLGALLAFNKLRA